MANVNEGERHDFAALCEHAKRNGLVVEVIQRPNGEQAIFVLPGGGEDFEVNGVQASMRIGVVASPFMRDLPFDGASPQLIAMLKERGYV